MTDLKLGITLWSQASDWPAFLAAAQPADELGYDHLWTWDHLQAIFGDPDQPIFEGYTALAAARPGDRAGRASGCSSGRTPSAIPGSPPSPSTTIDHISGGRAIMGLGGAWFEGEHDAFGIDFGSGFGQRLDWLAEAVPADPDPARRRRGDEPSRAAATPSTTCGSRRRRSSATSR